MRGLPDVVKLVIWDLDDTLWSGTLSEGEVSPVAGVLSAVRTLAERGILSTIVSKNDYHDAKEKLLEFGVWDLFVSPRISWHPKGQVIRELLDDIQLRPQHCVFIDDNPTNRAEAEQSCDGLTTAHPDQLVETMLQLPAFAGKLDKNLKRLEQYKVLERKLEARQNDFATNIEFLEDSDVEIKIEHNCVAHLDRIFELLDRTNQLNFTKRRLLTEADKKRFRRLLEHFQVNAAVIFCRDRFGDYGAVGFYLLRSALRIRRLDHFVFSCRIMNMGVESRIYHLLKRPRLATKGPVAYPVDTYGEAPWVAITKDFSRPPGAPERRPGRKVMLLGPCHVIQVSNYLHSTQTFEFAMSYRRGHVVRFDCPGFVLSDPEVVQSSSFLDKNQTWSKGEYRDFHSRLPETDRLLIDISSTRFMGATATIDGVCFGSYYNNQEAYQRAGADIQALPDVESRLEIARKMLDYVVRTVPKHCRVYVLIPLANKRTPQWKRLSARKFANFLKSLPYENVEILDLNRMVNRRAYNDGAHINRSGYLRLANAIDS